MSILNQISDDKLWKDFYEHKREKKKMRAEELADFFEFTDKKEYIEIVEKITDGKPLSLPNKKLVNKVANNKKRVVYTYSKQENYVLKLITQLLYKYDSAFSPNLYSFRQNFGVKRAFFDLTTHKNISRMYSYKVDIHDYFNSVDIDICIDELKEIITDDEPLLEFIIRLLREDRVVYNGQVILDSHGIMAGVPISSFLANVYLRKMDRFFEENNIIYARYSDDIIVFASSNDELEKYVGKIKTFLKDYKLEINPKKEVYTSAGEGWTFLGIQFSDDKIDISPVSLDKVKAKLRRKARALLRWKRKKGLENIYAARAFVKYINRYFYSNEKPDEMTWAMWYFPVITTDKSLKEIDTYVLELIRYIVCEKHNKSMYNFKYEEIKKLGYRPLVKEFYSRNNVKAD